MWLWFCVIFYIKCGHGTPEDTFIQISISDFCVESAGFLEIFSKPRHIIFAIMWKVWDSLKCFKYVKKNRDCVESVGSQKMPRWKVILLSVEGVGSQKIPC